MALIFLIWLIPISVADLASKRIPNVYLKVLGIFTIFHLFQFGFPMFIHLAIYFVVLLLGLTLRIGMGDLKLLALLFLSFHSLGVEFAMMLVLAALFHILVSAVKNRTIPASIPLAPAIFFAFITYLAAG